MDGTRPPPPLSLSLGAVARLMPMHLSLSAGGDICSIGPTLHRLTHGTCQPGLGFFDCFVIRRPAGICTVADLIARAGARLYVTPARAPDMLLRGLAVAQADGGALINFSFGSALIEAVRDHGLTESDFAPTDLAVELLYLVEAKAAIMEELRRLTDRLKGAKQLAEEHALTDTLTGLRNRRALDAVLADLIERRVPFGLMHVDLDYFKQVNDTFGHAAGDALLQHVAANLRHVTRSNDTVARVGGDEFVLLFPALTDTDTLTRIGQRLIEALTLPYDHMGQQCRIGASIGLTVSPLYRTPQAEQMQSDADAALYASKHAGRGRVTVHQP
jgi:diguanylate cyclase (GGDEF)-like protein